jgi:hypothetical protein
MTDGTEDCQISMSNQNDQKLRWNLAKDTIDAAYLAPNESLSAI